VELGCEPGSYSWGGPPPLGLPPGEDDKWVFTLRLVASRTESFLARRLGQEPTRLPETVEVLVAVYPTYDPGQ
jgi:hypothetical protein